MSIDPIGLLISSAIVIHTGALALRTCFERSSAVTSIGFLLPLLCCILANILAFSGFMLLTLDAPNPESRYDLILSVLSLLSAGVIAANFAHSHQEAAEGETWLSTALSALFALLFYVLFGAVCLYSGMSSEIHVAPFANVIIPIVAFMIMIANSIYDSWDWREE